MSWRMCLRGDLKDEAEPRWLLVIDAATFEDTLSPRLTNAPSRPDAVGVSLHQRLCRALQMHPGAYQQVAQPMV